VPVQAHLDTVFHLDHLIRLANIHWWSSLILIALQDTSALEVSSPSSAVQCKPFYETKDYEIKDYGVTVKPPLRTPDEPLGFVTRTSQARSRGGPPLLVVIVRVIVLALPTITLELVGTGPVPFWKVTTAP